MEVAVQIVSNFQVENVSPGKTDKRLNIFDINQFSSGFHQNDRTVPGHLMLVTDDLENGCMEKVQTSNISGTMLPIFFSFHHPCVLKIMDY